jgi:hypothetical protein
MDPNIWADIKEEDITAKTPIICTQSIEDVKKVVHDATLIFYGGRSIICSSIFEDYEY